MADLIPKKTGKPLFSQWFFFIVSFLLLVGVAVGFFVLMRLEQTSGEVLQALEETLARDTQPQEQALIAELTEYRDQVERFRAAANQRKDFAPLFALLEQSTHEGVRFTEFAVDRLSNQIHLTGEAQDFFNLEQQRLLWKRQEQIRKVEVLNMSLEQEGQIQFEARLTL